MFDVRENSLDHAAKTCPLLLRSLCSSDLSFLEDTWSLNKALFFNLGCRDIPFDYRWAYFLSDDSLLSSLLNDWLPIFLSHGLLVLLMNYGPVQLMNYIFVLFMNHRLMHLVNDLLMNYRLYFLMYHLLMMLMYNLLMMLDDQGLMMLIDDLSMMFLDYGLLHLSLNSWFLCVLNNFRLLFIRFDLGFLLGPEDLRFFERFFDYWLFHSAFDYHWLTCHVSLQ